MGDRTNSELYSLLKSTILPALGCTEPIAIAYSVALAKRKLMNETGNKTSVKEIEIYVDPFLFKNAMGVYIPGTRQKGALFAAALGYIIGDPDKKLEVISGVDSGYINKAQKLIKDDIIKLHIKKDIKSLYIETIIKSDKNKVRIITKDSHLNIVKIEVDDCVSNKPENKKEIEKIDIKKIQQYTLQELIKFVNNVSVSDLKFIDKGIDMNTKIADEGIKREGFIAKALLELESDGLLCNDAVLKAETMCAAAAEARMTGCKYPVMSSTGSGNQGITIFLTVNSFAEYIDADKERLLRALALSNLVAIYIKSYLGSLSVLCAAAVAAGAGAAGGVAYLMGGQKKEIFDSIVNVMGSITGVICDGAKGGCAQKVSLASGWAIKAALLAVKGVKIKYDEGILSDNFKGLIKNLAFLNKYGMEAANKTILEIMMKSVDKK